MATADQVPEDKLEQYRQLIESHPDLELKGGKKLPYTSLNGNMFTMLTKAGKVGLRMGQAERDTFIAQHNSKMLENYGTVMKEYVEVPDALLEDAAAMRIHLDISYAYAQTLKPKATKK